MFNLANMRKATALLLAACTLSPFVGAFVVKSNARVPTRLYLEDWVAKMIDQELYRQTHQKEFEEEWMEKNRAAVLHRMESDFKPVEDSDATDLRMLRKDKKLAFKDPERYCADRCVATGNCEIYEDFYELSPEDVVKFCTECVLSEESESCDIPDGFYDKLMP